MISEGQTFTLLWRNSGPHVFAYLLSYSHTGGLLGMNYPVKVLTQHGVLVRTRPNLFQTFILYLSSHSEVDLLLCLKSLFLSFTLQTKDKQFLIDSKIKIHLSIIFTIYLFKVTEKLEPIQADLAWEVEYTLGQIAGLTKRQTDVHTWKHLSADDQNHRLFEAFGF